MYETDQGSTRGSIVGRDMLLAKQRAAEQSALGAREARPLNRGSLTDGAVRAHSAIDRLREARHRLAAAVERVVGGYPTADAKDQPVASGCFAHNLHWQIDQLDEETSYILAAVVALEGSVE
jgi:hypothetical protein